MKRALEHIETLTSLFCAKNEGVMCILRSRSSLDENTIIHEVKNNDKFIEI